MKVLTVTAPMKAEYSVVAVDKINQDNTLLGRVEQPTEGMGNIE